MNVLYIHISSLPHVSGHGVSLDLIREFRRHGHDVYIVCALEKDANRDTYMTEEDGCRILRVKIGKNKKAGLIEKGLTTILEPHRYISAIRKYYSQVKFDLVLYPTPPITQVKTVEYIKKRDGAKSYLLLKDIFPQNAVDLGMLSKTGIKGFIYRYFRKKEKRLYKVSDFIGCMSQANADYVLKHNPEVNPGKVGICPNSAEIIDMSVDEETRVEIRKKYDIPLDKKVFIYGGNLGKPQGIPFIVECMKAVKDIEDAFFLIVGDGTEFGRIENYVSDSRQGNLKLMKRLPKNDYDAMVGACDVGMIFLDHRFTIPNFPSRLLSYMQAKIPVLACTDPNTDVGEVITDGGFGWWCESKDPNEFNSNVRHILTEDLKRKGEVAYVYMKSCYNSETSYNVIMSSIACTDK